MLLGFPWLFVSFGLYNLIAFSKGNAAAPQEAFTQIAAALPMASGAIWSLSLGDLLIALTLMLLLIEILQVTRVAPRSLVDHCLSLVLFLLCLVEFIVRREAATSVFFVIVFVAFIDVITGFWASINAARRDFAVGGTY